jgi:hypothetical protein
MEATQPERTTTPVTERPSSKRRDEEHEGNGGGLRGKAPEIFDGDRTKSKAFISDLRIYFQINRKKSDVKNAYSRVLLALSFIKGPNVVNWVETQTDQIEEELHEVGGDEEYEDLWQDFLKRFKKAYVSTTMREDAYVKMQKLQMKGDQLDEYIADHSTLVAELGWDQNSEMSCHSFREGLPRPLAKTILQNEGLPETYNLWVRYAQRHHARWAMSKALGYLGKSTKEKPKWNPHAKTDKKRPEKDPDAMDVDRTQMSDSKKEELMRAGKCFRCEKQGHLSRDCPTKFKAREAKIEPAPTKGKKKAENPSEPPPYDSLLKQINACSMEERQKLLESFSNVGNSDDDQDF